MNKNSWNKINKDSLPEGFVLVANFEKGTEHYKLKVVGRLKTEDGEYVYCQGDDCFELHNPTHFINIDLHDLDSSTSLVSDKQYRLALDEEKKRLIEEEKEIKTLGDLTRDFAKTMESREEELEVQLKRLKKLADKLEENANK